MLLICFSGALGMLTPHQSLEKGERSITEARRLETTMQNERVSSLMNFTTVLCIDYDWSIILSYLIYLPLSLSFLSLSFYHRFSNVFISWFFFLVKSIKYSAIYARTFSQANVVSEIFKRTARDAELKNALAHRKEREDERARVREIRINEFRQDITSKGPFPGTYHSQSEKILETEKDMNASCNGERDIEGQVEEEYIRDMASRVLQARWRIMRFLSSFISLFPSLLHSFLLSPLQAVR